MVGGDTLPHVPPGPAYMDVPDTGRTGQGNKGADTAWWGLRATAELVGLFSLRRGRFLMKAGTLGWQTRDGSSRGIFVTQLLAGGRWRAGDPTFSCLVLATWGARAAVRGASGLVPSFHSLRVRPGRVRPAMRGPQGSLATHPACQRATDRAERFRAHRAAPLSTAGGSATRERRQRPLPWARFAGSWLRSCVES